MPPIVPQQDQVIALITALKTGSDAFPITPSDSVDLAQAVRCLIVTGAGNIKVTTAAGNSVVLAVPVGYLPLQVTRVWSTGTTATGIGGIV